MIGDRLHSIGIQSLTIALLALAVLAYLTTVVSSPTASEVAKPMPGSLARPLPAADSPSTAKIEGLPEGPSSEASDRLCAPRRTPCEAFPEAVPFHGKKGDERYDPIILRAARDYGIDPAVIKAVIMAESGFDPQAVSHAGAMGLMQLMPRTAKELKVDDALDPRDNILGGTRYLEHLSSLPVAGTITYFSYLYRAVV